MANIDWHANEIKNAKTQIAYLHKRIDGIDSALKATPKEPVRQALEKELKKVQKDIATYQRTITVNENALRRLLK